MRTILFLLLFFLVQAKALPQPEPSNIPSEISVDNGQILVRYDGKIIFQGKVTSTNPVKYDTISFNNGGKVSQLFMLRGKDLVVNGKVFAGKQAFPCEVDRSASTDYDLVRHSVGLSHSRLNRAVYDRQSDWVFSVDKNVAKVVITPLRDGEFGMAISGDEIYFRFRPRFYQKHRRLEYYKPWEYQLPERTVAGWCSWFAFLNRVTEKDIRNTVAVLSEKLVPYGLEYLQIDDGYQSEPIGEPESWLICNKKFPGGLENLAGFIQSNGMVPAIWTNVNFHNDEAAKASQHLFIHDRNGDLVKSRWVGYCLDGSNPETINKFIRPTYEGLKKMGWKYFKVDGLRHLRYDGYNNFPAFFYSRNETPSEAFRNIVKSIREEIGTGNYLMACWGARPELAGIIDACRIGTDGYGIGGLSQYNSFNNVVWQNDPDHIEAFGKFAYRDCMATSMTGSLYMITDKPKDYERQSLEPIIRTIPVLYTKPGQIYDVDPTRSMYLGCIDTEVSGTGERIFDATRMSFNDLFLLEINKPYENWVILGRTGDRVKYVSFERLGLEKDQEYLVFDFWNKKTMGSYSGGFIPGCVDSTYKCQVFCIRKAEEHPQLLATNRHISCGAPDVRSVSWNGNQLIGESELVANDKYVIYVHEPEGYKYSGIQCDGAPVSDSADKNSLRQISIKSPVKRTVKWIISYETIKN